MFVRAHRGNTLAAGVVVLTAFVVEAELRAGLAPGVRLGLTVALAVLAGLGALGSPIDDDGPRTYQELLLALTALAVAASAAHLAALLGLLDGDRPAAGEVAVVAAVGAAAGLGLARFRHGTLVLGIGSILAVVALIAATAAWWPGDSPLRGVRLVLLATMVALALGVAVRIDGRYRQAVVLADVLAIAVVLLAASFLLEAIPGATSALGLPAGSDGSAGWAWQVLLVVSGFALVGLGTTLREGGPGWLGALGLVAALAVLAHDERGLGGWPLILLVAGLVLVVVALRPVEHEIAPDAEQAAGLEQAPMVELPRRPVLVPAPDDEDDEEL